VQGCLEQAIGQIADKELIPIIGSGRTDTGVHATGQIISFDLDWRHGATRLHAAINSKLPLDIVVRTLEPTVAHFHPRFDARRRGYVYQILTEPIPNPLERRRSWHVPQLLDVEAMTSAAEHLIGSQDFATFGTPPQGNNSVREIFLAEWQRSNNFLNFRIEANAFLYRMVRSIVGSLKLVGEGSWSVNEFVDALMATDRNRAGATAPPQGLTLTKVEY